MERSEIMPRLAGKQSNTGMYIIVAVVAIVIVLVLLQLTGVLHLIPAT